MNSYTPESLRIQNRKIILSLVFNEKILSRTEIANRSKMSKTTVSSLIEEMIKDNVIIEIGEGISTKQGGRKPINLSMNPDAFYIVGVDIGAYKTLFAISDASGDIILQDTIITETIGNSYDLMIIINKLKNMIEISGVKEKIIGMGIGIPGITDIAKGIAVSVPKLNWKNLNIKEIFQKEFGIKVYIDNDVNMGVLGEKWLGKGKRCNNFIFVSIGHGIGSGIMIDNKIYRGTNYSAGEIGYMALSRGAFKGSKYTLDGYGYFENVASAKAIENLIGLSCEEIFEKCNNNQLYKQAIDEMTDYLSMGICNIINVLNPEAVIIGGGVSNAKEKVLLPIKEKVGRLTPVLCNIEISELGGKSGVMGCIATVLLEKFDISLF
jgi:glucokinase